MMLNIVIPMAGRGSRFAKAGYTLPKPLIPVHGIPMIQVVCNNLKPDREHRFIFLCLKEHVEEHSIDRQLLEMGPSSEIVIVDQVTEGAACTVLLAHDYINNSDPLMIANSDQWVDININHYLQAMDDGNYDGFIMTMWSDHPKWSYVRLNDKNEVIQVVEKQVVSNEATVGIYNYTKGRYFVEATENMISRNLRVNNEFYVAPAYDQLVENGLRIGYYNVGKEYAGMHGMGIPSDLDSFTANPISRRVANVSSFDDNTVNNWR